MILLAVLLQAAGGTGASGAFVPVEVKRTWLTLPGVVTHTADIGPVADCLHLKAAKDTQRFLSSPLLGPEEQANGRRLLSEHGSCFNRPLVFSTPISTLRGALAQRNLKDKPAILDRLASRAPRAAARVPSIDGRPFLVSYAACLVAMQPSWAAAFLRTPVGSGAERRQFMQFGDTLMSCMPEDRTYKVDLPALRDEMAAVVDLTIARGDGA